MAFDIHSMRCLGSRTFTYVTKDREDDVRSKGYFDEAKGFLRFDDVIHYKAVKRFPRASSPAAAAHHPAEASGVVRVIDSGGRISTAAMTNDPRPARKCWRRRIVNFVAGVLLHE